MAGGRSRGRRRTVGSVLAESLADHPGATRVAAAAAFAEACGWPLSREVTVRGLGPDGHLWVVASSAEWAQQIEAVASELVTRMNARMGGDRVVALDVRVGRGRG
jgi:predicted NAD/FAD-dependent oxidoreductase